VAAAVEINALVTFRAWEGCCARCIWCHRNFGGRRCGAHRFSKNGATVHGVIFYCSRSGTHYIYLKWEVFWNLVDSGPIRTVLD